MFQLFKNPIGIYIGEGSVSAARAKLKGGKVEVSEAYNFPLTEGGLASHLKALQSKMGEKECVVNLPSYKVYNASLSFPKAIDDKTIEASLNQKLASILPTKTEELYIQHAILRGLLKDETIVLIAAVEKKFIKDYIKLLSESGWSKVAFVLDALAAARALQIEASNPTVLSETAGSKTLLCGFLASKVLDSIQSSSAEQDLATIQAQYMDQALPSPEVLKKPFDKTLKEGVQETHNLIYTTGLSLSKSFTEGEPRLNLLHLLK